MSCLTLCRCFYETQGSDRSTASFLRLVGTCWCHWSESGCQVSHQTLSVHKAERIGVL